MNDYRKLFPEPVSSVSSNIPIVNKSESLLKFSPTSTSEMSLYFLILIFFTDYAKLSNIFCIVNIIVIDYIINLVLLNIIQKNV